MKKIKFWKHGPSCLFIYVYGFTLLPIRLIFHSSPLSPLLLIFTDKHVNAHSTWQHVICLTDILPTDFLSTNYLKLFTKMSGSKVVDNVEEKTELMVVLNVFAIETDLIDPFPIVQFLLSHQFLSSIPSMVHLSAPQHVSY
jgi:hypothetical protein